MTIPGILAREARKVQVGLWFHIQKSLLINQRNVVLQLS